MRGLVLGSRSLLFSLVVVLAVCFLTLTHSFAENVGVSNIEHSPKEPAYDGSMNVYLELEKSTNVDKIEIFMCTLDPFICFYSDSMTLLENGTFQSIINLDDYELSVNMTLGYYFEITFKNTTKEKVPNESMEDDFDNILKMNVGVYYLTFTLGEGQETVDNGEEMDAIPYKVMVMMLIVLVISVVIAFILYRSKSNNGE